MFGWCRKVSTHNRVAWNTGFLSSLQSPNSRATTDDYDYLSIEIPTTNVVNDVLECGSTA